MSKKLDDWKKVYELRKIRNEEIKRLNGKAEKEAKINLIKKEIVVNKMYVEALEKTIPIINKFNGKVYNKRFEKALQEINFDNFNIYINNTYGMYLIDIYTKSSFDSSITYKHINKDESEKQDYLSINNKNISVYITNALINNDNGKKIINSSIIINNMYKKIESLKETNTIYENQLLLIDNMIKEFKELEKSFKEFNEKYDDRLKDLFEVNYYMKSY